MNTKGKTKLKLLWDKDQKKGIKNIYVIASISMDEYLRLMRMKKLCPDLRYSCVCEKVRNLRGNLKKRLKITNRMFLSKERKNLVKQSYEMSWIVFLM